MTRTMGRSSSSLIEVSKASRGTNTLTSKVCLSTLTVAEKFCEAAQAIFRDASEDFRSVHHILERFKEFKTK